MLLYHRISLPNKKSLTVKSGSIFIYTTSSIGNILNDHLLDSSNTKTYIPINKDNIKQLNKEAGINGGRNS